MTQELAAPLMQDDPAMEETLEGQGQGCCHHGPACCHSADRDKLDQAEAWERGQGRYSGTQHNKRYSITPPLDSYIFRFTM